MSVTLEISDDNLIELVLNFGIFQTFLNLLLKSHTSNTDTNFESSEILRALKMPNLNRIRNNITRSLIIFGIKKIDVSYCLLFNISALLSKSHFQTKTYSFVHKNLNI